MLTNKNPFLRGFNPDPSICRAGDDYYVAVSTFQWFPGVQIYHSRDLVNFELLPQPLNRTSQLNMAGNPNSGGIWAPCLSYCDGTFFLIYTDSKNIHGTYTDTHNYLVYTNDIREDWSEPVYLNSCGFDPSLFHDTDGKKYLLNMRWDGRLERESFAGIEICEYDAGKQALVSEPTLIYNGTNDYDGEIIGVAEGPHLYKIGEYYYLLIAEGGTGYWHGARFARSKKIYGPYLADKTPLVTTRRDPNCAIQKAGHASLVQTQNGEYYIAHLCARPIMPQRVCTIGRESAISRVYMTEDGWFRLENGTTSPSIEYTSSLPEHKFPQIPVRDEFDFEKLPPRYQTLRVPFVPERQSLTARKGWLRLYGRDSIASHFYQSMVARRQTEVNCEATVLMEFAPRKYQHTAGLAAFYDTENFFYLYMSRGDHGENVLRLDIRRKTVYEHPPCAEISIGDKTRIYLRVSINELVLRLSYSFDGENYMEFGPELRCDNLCDEAYSFGGFTGTFIAMACQDSTGRGTYADFKFMEYKTEF